MAEGTRDATPGPPVTVHAVGVARGNPGLAGAGIVITDATGVVRERVARYLGSATALHAQLQALALALRYARPFAPTPLSLVLGNEIRLHPLPAYDRPVPPHPPPSSPAHRERGRT